MLSNTMRKPHIELSFVGDDFTFGVGVITAKNHYEIYQSPNSANAQCEQLNYAYCGFAGIERVTAETS